MYDYFIISYNMFQSILLYGTISECQYNMSTIWRTWEQQIKTDIDTYQIIYDEIYKLAIK